MVEPIKKYDEQPLRWRVCVQGKDGFEFGLDVRTPQAWKILRTRRPKSEYSFTLPEPESTAYKEWLETHRGKVVVASIQELRRTIGELTG